MEAKAQRIRSKPTMMIDEKRNRKESNTNFSPYGG